MFPKSVETVLSYLPFQHIAYTPLLIYLGKLNGSEIALALAVQYLWTITLLALGAWFWKVMVRSITIHGG
jgi:ABC-2 type transport system permease protein